MKKGLLAFSLLTFGVISIMPTASANAHSWDWEQYKNYQTRQERREARKAAKEAWRCERLEKKEIRAWHRFDQDRQHRVQRVQRLIDRQEDRNCAANGTIVEQLTERAQFTTLAAALTEAELIDTFNGEGDFTVFAPTDQAFSKLGDETIAAVLADKELLTNILAYHVVDPAAVPNAVGSDVAVTLSSAPMFNGDSVTVELRGKDLFINDSKVVVTDLKTTNGIVHVIDTVLLPPM